jgi:hypothetical protein
MTVAFAGTQIHAEHRGPSCFSSKAGSRPGGEFTSFHYALYAQRPPTSYPGDARLTFSHRDLSGRTGYPHVDFLH